MEKRGGAYCPPIYKKLFDFYYAKKAPHFSLRYEGKIAGLTRGYLYETNAIKRHEKNASSKQ